MPDLDTISVYLECMNYAVVILGIPAALFSYRQQRRKDRETKEYEAYDALDQRFVMFQELCLAHPYLDIFDVKDERPVNLDARQKKEELIAFTILFTIFERAFTMYRDQKNEFRERQWSGWEEYIKSFCTRQNFRVAWKESGSTFDSGFQDYMKTMI